MKVIKRDASLADFDKRKIETAILKSMKNGSGIVKPDIAANIAKEIEAECSESGEDEIDISDIEAKVFDKLISKKQRLTAKSYEGYRRIREFQREYINTIDQDTEELIDDANEEYLYENSNKNSILNSTKRDYIAGIVSKDMCRRKLLPPDIVEAHESGILHIHDEDYILQRMHNCCLINLDDMLQNGTVISETKIDKPHGFATACTIGTQVVAQVASSQYGGQSISLAHLAPFVDVSRQAIRKEVEEEFSLVDETYIDRKQVIDNIVERRLAKEIRKGIQTIQYQITTLMTVNGQAPFVTLFMYLNEAKNEREKADLALLIEEELRQSLQGVKNEVGAWVTPAFPKVIYVLQEDNIHPGDKYWYLTELAARCSVKRLTPDYISEKVMKQYKVDQNGNGQCFPCMGKRKLQPRINRLNPSLRGVA